MIHPTAIIHPDTHLGIDVHIGAYATVGAQVSIGDGCRIGQHAVIEGPTSLGANNRIYPYACLGTDAQDLWQAAPQSRLEIGADNTFREFVTINRASAKDQGVTRIGDANFLMAYAHVAHDCTIGHHVIIANATSLGGHVTIGDYVNFGGLCAVHQFCRVGSYAMLGGGSMITRDIPPYVMAVGDRAKLYGLNRVGLQRLGFSADELRQLKQVYRLLFRARRHVDEVRTVVHEAGLNSPHVSHLLDFISASKRGIAS